MARARWVIVLRAWSTAAFRFTAVPTGGTGAGATLQRGPVDAGCLAMALASGPLSGCARARGWTRLLPPSVIACGNGRLRSASRRIAASPCASLREGEHVLHGFGPHLWMDCGPTCGLRAGP